MPTTLVAFLGACAPVAASPGPGTVLIIKQSLHSRRSGFLTVLGDETGVFGVQTLRQARPTKGTEGTEQTGVWFVGRLKTVLSRTGVRRRREQASGGVLPLLGVRMPLDT
ncbi:hypothetical protein [Streptomyces sp. AC550_RSS872]|uniref:hypothetical protein n=1 Tax=Streptomyces sp. AC550_RSS872 TaxID=2823689 RepID=UPI001C263ED6|nr:hypothetical protein [Streptomyces sp. AC550_RSS872]